MGSKLGVGGTAGSSSKTSSSSSTQKTLTVVLKFIEKKLDAIRCFKSQLKDFPNPRSEEAIVALSKYRGATVHVKSAEAFSLERSIR